MPPSDDDAAAPPQAPPERAALPGPGAGRPADAPLARPMTMWPGTGSSALQPEDLGALWRLARRQGARRLVLEVVEAGAHVAVRVLDREDGPAQGPPNLPLR